MRVKRAPPLIPCFVVPRMSCLEPEERNTPNHPRSVPKLTVSVIACGLLGGEGVLVKSGWRSAGDFGRKGEIHAVYQDRSPQTMAPGTRVKSIKGLVEGVCWGKGK